MWVMVDLCQICKEIKLIFLGLKKAIFIFVKTGF